MKRIPFILALGAALLAIAVSSAEAAGPYVGLYNDADHSICEVYMIGGFFPFELWVWWYPGDDGLMATVHDLIFPSNVIAATTTTSPDCALALGCECGAADPAYCCTRTSCANGWVWSHHISCFLTNLNPSWIEIVPCPGQSLEAASCALGYPTEPVMVLDNLALNQMCGDATEPVSWGAIKSLYR